MGVVILIVEDEPSNRKLFRDILESRQYAVIAAVDGRQAVELAVTRKPDLILMDIGLPGANGLDATRILKANSATRAIPILGLTAYAMKEDEEKAIRAGCDGFVAKPVEIGELIEQVARHFPGSRLDTSARQQAKLSVTGRP
ncbi:MAG: hypothetical protein A2147_05980 [Chloroflexi bacterium RBG_16_57_8]|nr:MAG: hypothetical protein A2147_05980 [Chloroflexi bacterium RBG_16_57_8]